MRVMTNEKKVFMMKVTLINCGPVANDSEQKAIGRLKSGLISELGDDEWLLLANLAFSTTHQRQSDEIDIVAIGPPGVRVIEVKHWTATWVKQNTELVEHEAERVMAKARKVGTTLRRKVSNGVFLVHRGKRDYPYQSYLRLSRPS